MRIRFSIGVVVLLTSVQAHANREPAAVYDARAVGMGGTAVAAGNWSSAPFHNPALMDGVKSLSIAATFSPYFPRTSGPWTTNPVTGATETLQSSNRLAPLPLITAGYRVHERVVVGLAVLGAGGGGALYEGVLPSDNDSDVSVAIVELQVPVSFRLTDRLVLGAAYRIGRAQADFAVEPVLSTDPSRGFVVRETNYTGTTFFAGQVGLTFDVTDQIRLAFNYRSKLSTDLTGETTVNGTTSDAPDINTSEPHKFVLGGVAKLLDDKLVIAADARYWLYSESHPKNLAEFRAADWEDALSFGVGGEYFVTDMIPVRAGYSIGWMATPEAAPSPFEWAPGTRHTFTVGTGVRIGQLSVDAGVAYAFVSEFELEPGPNVVPPLVNAGTYETESLLGSLTVAYAFN